MKQKLELRLDCRQVSGRVCPLARETTISIGPSSKL